MKRSKKLPEFLTGYEQERLLAQPNPRYISGERNYLLMKMILEIGTRLAEMISLEWKHIDLMSGKVMIRGGKGAKDRTLWLNEETITKLQHWKQRQIQRLGEKQDFVFTTYKSTQLKSRYVQQMIKRYAAKAKIEKKVTPHVLRHTFATDFFQETKDIRLTQKALGHTDVSTTMIYTHLVDEQLEDALKNLRRRK